MRRTLVPVLAVLAWWGAPAHAQIQPSKRLFFFTADPMNIGRATVFARPSDPMKIGLPKPFGVKQAPRAVGVQKPFGPTVMFQPIVLQPLTTPAPQDFRRFLKPKNTRLFFFTKP